MKKALLIFMIVLLTLAALGLTGFFLFRHFVTNRITDRGGMENPDAGTEKEQILDGSRTYAANDAFLRRIAGRWESADGRWTLTLDEDYGIALTLDGETVLEDSLEFSYLQPGEDLYTELELASRGYTLRRPEDGAEREISCICHEAVANSEYGIIRMELTGGESGRETVEFTRRSMS